MDNRGLFRVCTDAHTRVNANMGELLIHKNEVGRYAYNNAQTLSTQIERVLKRQMFGDSMGGMKWLARANINTPTAMKSTVRIQKCNVLKAAKESSDKVRTTNNKVEPEIMTNTNAQEEADRQNNFRLSAIGVKEAITPGIMQLVREPITNPILRTADGTDFKNVNKYRLQELMKEIIEGGERLEATNIRRQFVNIAVTQFDFRKNNLHKRLSVCDDGRKVKKLWQKNT